MRRPTPTRRVAPAGTTRARPVAALALPVAAGLLALVCVLAFWNSFRAEFLLDNQTLILNDPRLRAVAWQNVQQILTHDYWWPALNSDLFRPLTTISYWFNYSVLGSGGDPAGYHAVNLLLHWLNATLVFALVRSVSRAPWLSLVVAAVWASHPLTVEAVTNVVGRADQLAALSILGGLLLYRQCLAASGRQRIICLVALGGTYLAGVFSKENAVVLPALMLLHDVAFPIEVGPNSVTAARRWLARVWPAYMSVLPGLVLLLWARWVLFHNAARAVQFASDNPIAIAPLLPGVMTAIKVIGYYLALCVWPATLSCDYSFNQITVFGGTLAAGQDLHAWLALAVVIGIGVAAFLSWRRHRAAVFLLGFAAIALLPTSNLLMPIGTIMAERLMYLPLVGVAAAAVMALAAVGQWTSARRPALAERIRVGGAVVSVIVIAALMIRTSARNEDWTSSLRLWSSAERATPDSIKVLRGLARATMDADPSGGHVDQAIEIASRGQRILDEHPLPLFHMPAALFADLGHYRSRKADVLDAGGQRASALVERNQALDLLKSAELIDREINRQGRERLQQRGLLPEQIHDMGLPVIYRDLASAYLATGDPARAVATLAYLQHLQPASDDAHYTRGVAEGAMASAENARGDQAQAQAHLNEAAINLIEAVLLNPGNDAAWQTLAQVYGLLAASPAAVLTTNGRSLLNMEHPLVPAHQREAGERLVRQLDEGGLGDLAARWRHLLNAR